MTIEKNVLKVPDPELVHSFDKAVRWIASANRIVLASPRDPDVDSCMSMLAFGRFLRWVEWQAGVPFTSITLYAPNAPEANTLFTVTADIGDPRQEIITDFPLNADLCVVFDYGDFNRVKVPPKTLVKMRVIGFDHHPPPSGFPESGLEIRLCPCPSTTTLLAYFFAWNKYIISSQVATALFAGLVADTGRFSHGIEDGKPFEICAHLATHDACIKDTLLAASQKTSIRRFNVHQIIIKERLTMDADTGLAFFWFSRDDLERWNAEERDALSFVGTLMGIQEVELVAAYHQKADGAWYCSFRSRNGAAKSVAEILGGGGQSNQAGCMAKNPNQTPADFLKEMKHILQTITVHSE